MMHWLLHASPRVPPSATVALFDPDMFFLRPLWHDSFDSDKQFLATGAARETPPPRAPLARGQMIAQRYGIGGKPWTSAPGRNGQKTWNLGEYFRSINRARSPALAKDLDERSAANFFSIGAPYIALAADWLPIATNWTGLMPMAVERNFGNLAEMYAMVIAVADYGIRPKMVDSLMVSDVGAGGEGWPWVDGLPMDRGCNPATLTDEQYQLPTFLHYCQSYEIQALKKAAIAEGVGGQGKKGNEGTDARAFWLFSKYQVPIDPALSCGQRGGRRCRGARKRRGGKNMKLVEAFCRNPVDVKRHTRRTSPHLAHCTATRKTNQAAHYRKWFVQVAMATVRCPSTGLPRHKGTEAGAHGKPR